MELGSKTECQAADTEKNIGLYLSPQKKNGHPYYIIGISDLVEVQCSNAF